MEQRSDDLESKVKSLVEEKIELNVSLNISFILISFLLLDVLIVGVNGFSLRIWYSVFIITFSLIIAQLNLFLNPGLNTKRTTKTHYCASMSVYINILGLLLVGAYTDVYIV